MSDKLDEMDAQRPNASSTPRIGNVTIFLALYLFPAFLSYFSLLFLGLADIFLAICYLVMLLACVIRGLAISRNWLVVFPIAGFIFDVFIPIAFVPTVLSILLLVLAFIGVSKRPTSESA